MAEELARISGVVIGAGVRFANLTFSPPEARPGADAIIQVSNDHGNRWMKVRFGLTWEITRAILEAVVKGEPNPFNALTRFTSSLLITGIPRDDGQGLVCPPWLSFLPTKEKAVATLVAIPIEYTPRERFKILGQGRGLYTFPICLNETVSPQGSGGKALIVAVVSNSQPLIVRMPSETFTVANMDGIHSDIQTEEEALSFLPTEVAEPEPEPVGTQVATAEPEAVPSEQTIPVLLEPNGPPILVPTAATSVTDAAVPAAFEAAPAATAPTELEGEEPKPTAKRGKKPRKYSPVGDEEGRLRDNGKGKGSRGQQRAEAVTASQASA